MKTRATLPGRFWLDASAQAVPGSLHLGGDESPKLSLEGALAGPLADGLTQAREFPRIYGELHSVPSGLPGTSVTIFDAFTTQYSLGSSGSERETLVANQIFVGDELIDSLADKFPSARFQIEGLDQWVPGRLFEVEARSLSLKVLPQVVHAVDVDGAKISFRKRPLWRGNARPRCISYEEQVDVVVEPSEALDRDSYWRLYLRPLQWFIALARGVHRGGLEMAEYVIREAQNWPEVVREMVVIPESSLPKTGDLEEPLVPFPEHEQLSIWLKAWLELSRRHRGVLGLVFGLLAEPPRFTEQRFRLATEALELVSTRIACRKPDAFAASTPAAARLMQDVPAFFDSLARDCKELWGTEAPDGVKLLYMHEALMWLVRLMLLDAIGVPLASVETNRGYVKQSEHIRERLAIRTTA